jgi:hypothetical protein
LDLRSSRALSLVGLLGRPLGHVSFPARQRASMVRLQQE